MKLLLLWLAVVSVPLALAACLLLIFPALLESRILIALSYFLGAAFLLMVALVTWGFLVMPKKEPKDDNSDFQI